MKESYHRREFIKTSSSAALGMSFLTTPLWSGQNLSMDNKKIGIIGLDTSHCIAFTELFNDPDAGEELGGYRVVAAYPEGSRDIESSYSRIPGYTEDIKKLGVQIVGSIEELADGVDAVLLETNDGRLHLEQALPVLKAGKIMFIDKPVTASLSDAIILYDQAKRYEVPIFSSSSLRFIEDTQAIARGKVGRVLGASSYSPSKIEQTHPDLFWYGIHGVEALYTVMGTGCKSVVRVHTEGTDVVVGVWEDGRVGTFRGIRTGGWDSGGTVFGEKGYTSLGQDGGYKPLLIEIAKFFQTGKPPVRPEETLELLAFMEAADESKKMKGVPVNLDLIWERANKETTAKNKLL